MKSANILSGNNRLQVQKIQQLSHNEKTAWAAILKNNAKGKMVNNAGTLHYDDYKDLSRDIVKAREFMNVGTQDLISRSLTTQSDIGKTIVSYETMNTFGAQISMNASNREENQSDYQIAYVPQPIYHTDFFVPWRQGGFDYKQSDGVTESVYRVNELQDKTLFLGADLGVVVAGADAPLFGYTNHPATILESISDWSLEANTDLISKEAITLVGALYVGGKGLEPDSVMMYVATDVWSNLQNDYASAKGDATIYERILKIAEIIDVKPQKDLPAGGVQLVEMRARTVQLSVAQNVTAVPWVKSNQLEDGRFTVFSSMVAKIKADRSGKSGLLFATKT